MSCPSLELLASYRADRSKDSEIGAHLEECSPCRGVLSTLAASPEPSAEARREHAAGAEIGRFVVEGVLGRGAMGVVYTAHDPRLGRRVALKLMRAGAASKDARARMLREAQAMARLAHPNVVVVYEAGLVDDEVFIAMELVEGGTLADWLAGGPRPFREALDALVQAGRGLAAAHEAGVVHRDFKPANVLLGKDGRARVTDFGLAGDSGEAAAGASFVDGGELTRTGSVLGTPAYMAPEQRHGERATPLSDQYSFAVSLHEALFGERPAQGQPAVSSRGGVPNAVWRALERALATAPADRWPSMAALVAALEGGTVRRRHWIALGAALAVTAAGTALAIAPRARSADPCPDAGPRLAGVWDDGQKQALRAALGDGPWRSVEPTLDAYTSAWVARRNGVCRAPAEPADIKQARLACLDQRLENLRGWVAVHATGDAALVARAAESARGRDELAMCDEAVPMLQPVPQDPALRERVQRVRAELQAQRTRLDAGLHEAAFAAVLGLEAAAHGLGYLPLEAEAANAIAYFHEERDHFELAIPYFRKAAELAEEARYDVLRARAWIGLAAALDILYRYEESNAAVRYAEAVLKPMPHELMAKERIRLDVVSALNLWGEGKLAEAAAIQRRATLGSERLYGAESAGAASALFNEGGILIDLGRIDDAESAFRHAEAIYRKLGGDGHPMIAKIANYFGEVAAKRGDHETSLVEYRRALELKLRRAAPDSYTVGVQHANIGEALVELGRPEEALEPLRRAREIVLARLGPKNEVLGVVCTNIGLAELKLGRPAAAIAPLEEALAARESVEHPLAGAVSRTRFTLARALWEARRDRKRALALAEQARAGSETAAEIDAWIAARR